VVRGREILSGTNLASLQLPNGMGYGQWRLMAVGQGSGSVELSLEYGNSPLARLTTTFVVYPTPELAVDANRDHVVTLPHENDSDVTTADTPFRFWLNDDVDRGHTVDDTDYEQDDIGPTEAAANDWPEDWTCNFIPSERDLEDFTRLSLTAEGWERSLQTGEISLGLKWAEVTGNPAIKLYPQVEREGGTSYLTDSLAAGLQRLQPALLDERGLGDDLSLPSARTVVGSDDVFVLPADFWAENGSRRSLLFEGCRAGTGCLRPVLLRREAGSYVEIGELPGVWFDLKRIGDMYEHWSVGNGNGVAPAAAATRVPAETGGGGTFTYTADDPENREYILYVHGWNMEKWEKERFAETAYKRLYWQGYRGRFGLFSWPTTYGFDSDWDAIFDRTNFDRGEFVAWRSAAPLRQLLQDLAATYHGELYVFSHSMGAVVASEALRLQSDARGPQVAKVYVAGQAALSAHVYDGSLGEEPGAPDALQWRYTHPRLKIPGDYGPDTPDVYRNWAAFIASGSAVSTAAVGRVVNFYNENDFALSAPVWQFDQLTKPDFADFPDWLWEYRYDGDPAAAPTSAGFRKFGKFTNITGEVTLHLGTRTDPADRYEIMAFAAESHVKALGATADVHHGISGAVDLRSPAIWRDDRDNHSAHKWHSGEFRSTIQEQRNVWKTLLEKPGFDLAGAAKLL
ncbi:MAG TPA: alpha/beta hydrolase, partial [Phycisphaerae bacterium]|nr:alpha/beta hydrolase [Phycisphaerae bacterium]